MPPPQDVGVELHTFRRQGLQGYTQQGWGGYVGCIPVPPSHLDPCLSYKGEVRREEGPDSAACLLRPSLPIRAEARADPSAEFSDGPLGPLLARSYPDVNGRPSLARDPILPHLITQGGTGDLGLEL